MNRYFRLCATNPRESTLAICPKNNSIDYLDMYNYIVVNKKIPLNKVL